VADVVLEEMAAWQSRGLVAPTPSCSSTREGLVNNRAVYLAVGVRYSGDKGILGLWIEQTEGA
jgi:putative transposase